MRPPVSKAWPPLSSGPAGSISGRCCRVNFAELTEIYQIESDFEVRWARALDAMISRAGRMPREVFA